MGLRERVRVASPRAADWPSARAPAPRPARAPSPWAPLLAPGGGYGLARPGGEGGSAGGSRVLGAGGPSRSWKRVFCLLFSTPCAWSCRFQEEELRGTSRGSGAARGAGLSSAPSLLAFPRLPWLSRSLECLQRTGGGGGAGGVLAPEPLDAPPDTEATGPRLLRCYDSRGGGLGREDTPLLSLLLWAPLETLKKCLRFSIAEIERLEAFLKFKRNALSHIV